MLPMVVAGGLLIALSFVFGIEAFKEEGTLAAALMQIGGGTAFAAIFAGAAFGYSLLWVAPFAMALGIVMLAATLLLEHLPPP